MFVSLHPVRGLAAALFLFTSACAADDDGDDAADESSTGSSAGLEIVGEWVDDFMGTHSITEDTWVQGFGPGMMYTYTIDHFDNAGEVIIAQSADDMTWSRFDWTEADDGTLYYCQTAFGVASAEAAENTPRADDSAPMTGGCGMFGWSALHPA